MKLGIRSIESIPVENVDDYSFLSPGSKFDFSSFIKGDLTELPFVPDTGSFSETWKSGADGKYSEFTFSATIRRDKEKYRSQLQSLTGRRHIFQITLISGVKYVIGSRESIPTFGWSDVVSGTSSNEFTLEISNNSLHGVLINSK